MKKTSKSAAKTKPTAKKTAAKSKSPAKAAAKSKSPAKAAAKSKSPAKAAAKSKSPAKAAAKSKARSKATRKPAAKPGAVKLLSGGNPQIAKADGDAPVQAYIAALPGWKGEVGRQLDALIVRSVPEVRKAVKWNSPFYGIEGQGWFLGVHVYAQYIKLAFLKGALLRPLPPGASKQKNVRYLDIREHDKLDKAQLADWMKQAAALPGWSL